MVVRGNTWEVPLVFIVYTVVKGNDNFMKVNTFNWHNKKYGFLID